MNNVGRVSNDNRPIFPDGINDGIGTSLSIAIVRDFGIGIKVTRAPTPCPLPHPVREGEKE
ncbi:MAG: hypothetical protein OHK0029_37140 [Armatimonadaceae bacterium]